MAVRKSKLRISYSQEIVNGEPIFSSSNSLPIKALKFEPAGHAFNTAALKLLGCFEKKDVKNENPGDVNGSESEPAHTFDSYSNKSKKKSGTGEDQQDHYALLGLGHLRYLATDDQIRKAYRDAALRNHPDKLGALLLAVETEAGKQAKKDEIESQFQAIQQAYELLTDPVRRRVYDSTDEFDDEIPNDCTPQEFFKVFVPAFMRNGRWSVNQPVPSLGDENTPIVDVDKFYDFWYSFKSWREFPHADEFDLEEAESRDHKRWMERQNAKLSEKARKEENIRIRCLVDNAYRKDPRILRRKELEKAEKQRKKEAKIMAKKLQEEEAARIVEEERRKKEEEAKRAAEIALQQKKLREKEKKLLRKERSRLRTLSAAVVLEHLLDITDADVESLCTSLNFEQLKSLCDKIEAKEGFGRAKLIKVALGYDQEDIKPEEEDEKRDSKQNGSVEVVNLEEIKAEEQAEKDLKQNGSVEVVNLEEIKAEEQAEKKDLKQNGSVEVVKQVAFTNNVKKEKAWSKEEVELLRKAIQKYPKGTSRRWEVISEYIGTGRSVEEILKATKTVLLQKPDSTKAFDSFLEKRKSAPSIASPLSTREAESIVSNGHAPEKKDTKSDNSLQEESCTQKSNSEDSNGSTVTDISSNSDQEDTWSVVQVKALLQAIKTFPKEANQRWERIAAAVPGKNVNQCKKKFASMKDNFRNKKGSV